MPYIPITGLEKKSGYIPIQGLSQIAEPMAESTIAVAPQGGGFLSGLKNVTSKAYEGFKDVVLGVAEKSPGIRAIANIQSGMPIGKAFKKGFAEPEKEVQIAKEKIEHPEAILTPTQMAEAESAAFGFLGGGMKKVIPEIETAKKLGYKVFESAKGFTNKLFKYRIQKGQNLMYANTPEDIASLTGQLKKVGGVPEISKELEPLSAESFAKSQGIKIEVSAKLRGTHGLYEARTNTIKIPEKLPTGFNRDEIIAHEIGHSVQAKLGQSDLDIFNKLVKSFKQEVDASLTRIRRFEEKGGKQGYLETFADLYGKYIRGEKLPAGNQFKFYFDEVAPLPKDFYTQATKGIKEVVPVLSKAAVNIERLNISQEAKQTVIKASEEIKPQLEAVKGKVLSNSEVIEAAQQSEILRRGTTREATLKSEAAILKTREHLAELAKNEKLTPEFIDTLKTISAEATRRGRELQALGIEADPILGTIKTKLVKQLLDMGIETEKIIKASEGIDFNNAAQVTKFFRGFVKPTLPQIIDEYRYINMLSSPKTQIVNTFSNILQATILKPATRLASGVVDNIAHILTGKEQEFYIKQVPAYYRGAFNSFGDALSETMKVMRGQQQIYRPDVKNIPTGLKILRPFQVVPRLMEASDVFFRRIISGGEIEALMSKGVKEAEAVSKAAKTAEEYIFRKALDPANKTGQGVLLSKIDALTTAVYKLRNVPGVKWFIPFVQTPMNILKQGIEYSPLGISTLPGAVNKIEQFGKTLVGTTIFAGAGWLALKDLTTWAVPINQKEKDAFYAAGMQPYSLKIGDTWVSYSRLGPLAYPIAMAAAIKFYTKDNPKAATDTELQKITKIFSGIAQFFSDQSYVQGIGDFVNIAQGDITALTRMASQIPSQLIPLTALQRWVANIIDPIYRKTDKKLSVEGIIENLKSGIPGLKENLPPYTTPSGEPSQRQYPYFNPLLPISISEESPQWRDYFNTLRQVSKERLLETKSKEELKQSAQDIYNKMEALSKEEAFRQFEDLIQNNPDLAQEVSDLASKVKLDYKEDFLKSLRVENGQRAKYIVEEINKLKTKEEKGDYYQNLIDKKIITKQVGEQVLKLLGSI